jgi:Rrf2 family nitric oxide-sensitive transcriptional repressor
MRHIAPVHLNLQTDYGLRILMLLTASERQMSVDEIARRYRISRNHLAKVAHRLQALGYVSAVRGRAGGLTLAVEPDQIIVGTIVRQLESLETFVECMSPERNTCPAAGLCGLQGALGVALQDFLSRLDTYTVADLVPSRQRFARRVNLPAPGQAEPGHASQQ